RARPALCEPDRGDRDERQAECSQDVAPRDASFVEFTQQSFDRVAHRILGLRHSVAGSAPSYFLASTLARNSRTTLIISVGLSHDVRCAEPGMSAYFEPGVLFAKPFTISGPTSSNSPTV